MASINVGDTVEVSFKGEVTFVSSPHNTWVDVLVTGRTFAAPKDACTVVTPPLQVGDIISAENALRLPMQYILADKDGSPWDFWPSDSISYGPFTLVYIHNPSNES